eukprot:8941365-Alexandrium_andersonii.AAC.1
MFPRCPMSHVPMPLTAKGQHSRRLPRRLWQSSNSNLPGRAGGARALDRRVDQQADQGQEAGEDRQG